MVHFMYCIECDMCTCTRIYIHMLTRVQIHWALGVTYETVGFALQLDQGIERNKAWPKTNISIFSKLW